MKRLLLTLFGLLLEVAVFGDGYPLYSRIPWFNELVVLGDSVSDNGIDPKYDVHGFNRFSNGPIWADYLADNLGLDNRRQVKNYAYSGGKSGLDNYYMFGDWSGILWQTQQYVNSFPGTIPETSLIALQLGGANDLLEGANIPDQVAQNGMEVIKTLVNGGAKNIIVISIVDISIAPPYAADLANVKDAVSSNTAMANKAILSGIQTGNFDSRLYYFDINSAIPFLQAKYANNTVPYTHHRTDTRPSDIWSYLFYDNWHMTSPAHRDLADLIFETMRSSP
jgi:phospholipase/lecithinase/hemolysin